MVDRSCALFTPLAAVRLLACCSMGDPVPSNRVARDGQDTLSLELALAKRSQGSLFEVETEQSRLAPMRVCCSMPQWVRCSMRIGSCVKAHTDGNYRTLATEVTGPTGRGCYSEGKGIWRRGAVRSS